MFNNIFGNTQPPKKPTAAAQQPNDQGTGQPAGTPGGQPAAGGGASQLELKNQSQQQPTGGSDEQASPLDPYKDLWSNPSTDNDQGKPKPFVDVDRKQLLESAKRLKYSSLVPPELVQKALGGDAVSFGQILDTVGQSAFANATQAALAFMERGFTGAESRFFERLPSEMRKHALTDTSDSDNPLLNHEAVKPMLTMVKQQMAQKYPQATTSQIEKMAKDYLTHTLAAVSPQAAGPAKKPASTPRDRLIDLQQTGNEIDWNKEMFGEEQAP